jgi:glycosyltransferase involved in cell wall biosynthesis
MPDRRAAFQALFVGRMEPEKGVSLLVDAWRDSGVPDPPGAALVLVGDGPFAPPSGAVSLGRRTPVQLRNSYAGSDVLVLPSIPTPAFREPWGLVVNEAMHQGLPVIASDAVGAAAGGLVTHERTGLVVPAGDRPALAAALRRLHDDPELRRRLGAAARAGVAAYSFDAWADGMVRGLAAVGAARSATGPLLA